MHKLHLLLVGVYGLACFRVFHVMSYSISSSFNSQMYLLSSVVYFFCRVFEGGFMVAVSNLECSGCESDVSLIRLVIGG